MSGPASRRTSASSDMRAGLFFCRSDLHEGIIDRAIDVGLGFGCRSSPGPILGRFGNRDRDSASGLFGDRNRNSASGSLMRQFMTLLIGMVIGMITKVVVVVVVVGDGVVVQGS